jgi:hypothetical protein
MDITFFNCIESVISNGIALYYFWLCRLHFHFGTCATLKDSCQVRKPQLSARLRGVRMAYFAQSMILPARLGRGLCGLGR